MPQRVEIEVTDWYPDKGYGFGKIPGAKESTVFLHKNDFLFPRPNGGTICGHLVEAAEVLPPEKGRLYGRAVSVRDLTAISAAAEVRRLAEAAAKAEAEERAAKAAVREEARKRQATNRVVRADENRERASKGGAGTKSGRR